MGFHIHPASNFPKRKKGIVKASIILGVPKQKNIAELLELKQPWITGLEVKREAAAVNIQVASNKVRRWWLGTLQV